MAAQIQVTALSINNVTQPSPVSLSFPSAFISVQAVGSGSQINYQSVPIFVSESISDIATAAGGDMFAATIWAVGGNQQPSGLDMLFPSIQPSISEASGTNINSKIEFNGIAYYAEETASDLIDSANEGGGGGGVTIYTGDGSLSGDRTVDLNGHFLMYRFSGSGMSLGSETDNVALVIGGNDFEVGDYYNNNSGTNISLNTAAQVITMGTTAESWLGLDGVGRVFRFGLSGGPGNDTAMSINDTTEIISFKADNGFSINGQPAFTGTLADAITGTKSVVNGLIIN